MTVHQVPYPTAPLTWSSRTYTADQDSIPNHQSTATCSHPHRRQTTTQSAQYSRQLRPLRPPNGFPYLKHPLPLIQRPPSLSAPSPSTSRRSIKKSPAQALPAQPPSLAAPPLAAHTTTASANTPRALVYSGRPPFSARSPTATKPTSTSIPRSSIRWTRAPPANTALPRNPAPRTITPPKVAVANGSAGAAARKAGRGGNITVSTKNPPKTPARHPQPPPLMNTRSFTMPAVVSLVLAPNLAIEEAPPAPVNMSTD